MRVLNCHTARVAKIPPGEEGELPDDAPVQALLAAGLLRRVDGSSELRVRPPAGPAETEKFRRAWDEREKAFAAAYAELERVVAARDATIEDLAARLAAASSSPSEDVKPSRKAKAEAQG